MPTVMTDGRVGTSRHSGLMPVGACADSPGERSGAMLGTEPQGHQAGRTRGHIRPRQIDPLVHHAISLAGHLLEWIKKEHLTDQE